MSCPTPHHGALILELSRREGGMHMNVRVGQFRKSPSAVKIWVRPGYVHNPIPVLEGTYPEFALEDLEFKHGDLLMRSALAQEGDHKIPQVPLFGSGCRRDRRVSLAELAE